MTNHDPGTQRAARMDVVVVRVSEERVALPLETVREILPAVASASLPDAPPVVCGVINLRGTPLPLLSLRERLGLPTVKVSPESHIVVCEIDGRRLGLRVDGAEAVTTVDRGDVAPAADVASARHLQGVAMLPEGLILMYDVRSFLAGDEALRLDEALAAARSAP